MDKNMQFFLTLILESAVCLEAVLQGLDDNLVVFFRPHSGFLHDEIGESNVSLFHGLKHSAK